MDAKKIYIKELMDKFPNTCLYIHNLSRTEICNASVDDIPVWNKIGQPQYSVDTRGE